MSSDLAMVLVVVAAIVFAFSNGFHDTFDLISTAVSTGAAPPHLAIAAAAALNFLGAFVSVAVAATIIGDVVKAASITPVVVLAGLLAAIGWNLATWRLSLPSSSSHALIGGLLGATVAAAGIDGVIGSGVLDNVLVPALLAPLAAFLLALLLTVVAYRAFGNRRPGPVGRAFRRAQVFSGGLLALAHGANDAQKTMGVVTLALIAKGSLGEGADPPLWVMLAAATALALGTYGGGWRILRGGGGRVIRMDPAQGFSAQGAGATALLAATALGYPISSTHAVSGGVMGAGATQRLSAVRWGVAGDIVAAWLLTLPASAAAGAAVYGIARLLVGGA